LAAPDGGAVTGSYETFLSVGGLTLRIASDDCRLASPAGGPLEPFFSDRGRADVEIFARWTDTDLHPSGHLLFDSGGAWQLHQSSGEYLFTFRSSRRDSSPYKSARFNPAFTAGEVQLSCRHYDCQAAGAVYPLEYPLDELTMIHLLSRGRGVEIHACGLLDPEGRAYVFPGQSGAGKSTMARLWIDRPGVRLLTDERVVLRTDRAQPVAYGTPWHGEAGLASPLAGDLAAMFFLHHGPAHSVVPVARSQAAARLFACSFVPFHSTDAVDRTMAAIERATTHARCYDLWFTPDRSIVDVVTSHMG
jgi:hypothetical protein